MKMLRFLAPLVIGSVLTAPVIAAETSSQAAGAATLDSKGQPVAELGKIAPDGPFRLWTAINRVLLDYASLKGGNELRSQVEGLSPGQFYNRTPGDVLTQTAEFRATLEKLRARLDLPKVRIYEDPLGREVTPGVVFVNAGHIMDATVFAYYTASDKPDEALGNFYDVPVVTGKTPSDVFGLVQLATRRLQLIAGS